jgi:hypothetical protein
LGPNRREIRLDSRPDTLTPQFDNRCEWMHRLPRHSPSGPNTAWRPARLLIARRASKFESVYLTTVVALGTKPLMRS